MVEEQAPAWLVLVSDRGFKRWCSLGLDEEGRPKEEDRRAHYSC